MNTNQTANIFGTILQLAFGALVTKGLISSSEAETLAGGILALVTFIVTHNWHGSSKPPGAGVASLVLIAALSLGVTGCQSDTAQKVAYRSANTTIVTVETAMHAYNVFAAGGHTTPQQNAQVKSAYEKYQRAIAVLCDAGAIYAATGSDTNSPVSGAVSQAASDVGQDLSDLLALIRSFGVKV